ncbi:MAG: hypothetical protein V4503_11060 [Gemmatimonadota bacterium]
MPKRTNEFQQLVYLLKKQLAGDAMVTESKFLRDRISGLETEVDICIEVTTAGHGVILSLECTDERRKATIEWVREMYGKHASLPTNALILASRSGFTKGALATATGLGIATMDLQHDDAEVVDRVLGSSGSLWGKVVEFRPTKVVVTVQLPEGKHERVRADDDIHVFNVSAERVGTIRGCVEQAFQHDGLRRSVIRDAIPEHTSFVVEWEPPKFANVALYLQWDATKELRLIEHVRVEGTFRCVVSEFRLNHGKLGDVSISWGTGIFLDQPAILLASRPRVGPPLLTLHLGQRIVKREKRR